MCVVTAALSPPQRGGPGHAMIIKSLLLSVCCPGPLEAHSCLSPVTETAGLVGRGSPGQDRAPSRQRGAQLLAEALVWGRP